MAKKPIESVDASTGPMSKDPGMGDPTESDAAKDAESPNAKTLADIEAARGMKEGSSHTVEGNAFARQLTTPAGSRVPGSRRCGNPIGYGHCDGEIEQDDPEGRCSKCGIPTRAAAQTNAGRLQGGYDQMMGKIVEVGGSTRDIQQASLEREGARLAITRAITAEVFAEFGWNEEIGAEHSTMPHALKMKWAKVQTEVDRRLTAALRACELAPRPSRAA